MEELKKIKLISTFGIPFLFFFFFLIIILICTSGSDNSVVAGNYLSLPFANKESFKITSNFGMRMHPIDKVEKFHTGIDLGSSLGTPIIASGDGYIVDIGQDDDGFGNYICIEHNFSGAIFYTFYGHLLDDSIIVTEGQQVANGEQIASVGNTGKSTAPHLHFTVMSNKYSFEKKNLVDPTFIIKGLN